MARRPPSPDLPTPGCVLILLCHLPFHTCAFAPGRRHLILALHGTRPRPGSSPRRAALPNAFLSLSLQASSAEQLRKEGNELFKCGDYEGALTAYTQALSLGATPQDQAILHRNRAACHLKLVRGSGCSNLVLPGPGIAHSRCCLCTSWAFPSHARLPEVFRRG